MALYHPLQPVRHRNYSLPCQAPNKTVSILRFRPVVHIHTSLEFGAKYGLVASPVVLQAFGQPSQDVPIALGLGTTWDWMAYRNGDTVG
ncbi:hypothetical protein DPMN_126704 [Dreissena polymorpha]|uniref:Uncharacterized protein n=1 Tax=Dreissena polymorpha TaxID=45954 RepID=A0A9D4GZZ3_DREPO|nr:hypothetical protein DPMN_126704 [Dreissena polymorpha]